MKYIRTKNGIFEIDKLFSVEYITIGGKKYNLTSSGLNDKVIDFDKMFGCKTRQADAIEELCDEFVIKYESKDKVSLFDICNNFEATKEEYNNYQNEYKNANIYGAIWTDKGLIYVAKMNDKGELELL